MTQQIGKANFHAQGGEPLCSGEADPTGAAGNHRGASHRQCRMLRPNGDLPSD